MKEETCKSPEAEVGSKGIGNAPGRDQFESVRKPHKGQEMPSKRMQQIYEVQWQQFLKTMNAPHLAHGAHCLSEATPWDDSKAFLASFEQVAAACQWPREEWVARLLPALSGGAQQAFSLLAAPEQEDYRQVKAAILRGEALRREKQRQHFRQFCCPQLGDPQRMYSQVQELCCQWLKPERHSKEQILELLVLEQFLAGLPGEIQSQIRACGPDSGAQAVALLEDFQVSRTEANTGTWQELLQEWSLGPPDIKKEPLDVVQEISKGQAEKFGDTQQNINGEVTLPGTAIAHPTLLPPEGQDTAEVELTKAIGIQVDQVLKQRKMFAPLQMVEQTSMQSNQQTTFWKVLQEDDENVESQEGSLSSHLEHHVVKKEDPFLPDPVQSLRPTGLESDVEKATQLTVINSQLERKEPLETWRRGQGRIQENVSVTDEMQEETCESTRKQGIEPHGGSKQSDKFPEGLETACSNASLVVIEGEKASFSKCGRMNHPKSILVFEHGGELCNEGPLLEEKIQQKSKFDKHDGSHTEEENRYCKEFMVTLHSNTLEKDQIIHTGQKPHNCPDCGKSFSRRSNLLTHQVIHTGKKLHTCTECGKSFSRRSYCLTHQRFHTEQKPHKCPDCGNRFSQKSALLTHQMIHVGKKPHQCPECERSFFWRSQFLMHQRIHTVEKPHKCPDCGNIFSRRSTLLEHQMIHTGKKPHQCPECGKNFSRRSTLLEHQMIHTGKKPHQCPECGRSFFSKSNLRRHKIIHIGEKPHICSACGKSFSHRAYLLKHQKIHTREKLHKYPDCGNISPS